MKILKKVAEFIHYHTLHLGKPTIVMCVFMVNVASVRVLPIKNPDPTTTATTNTSVIVGL